MKFGDLLMALCIVLVATVVCILCFEGGRSMAQDDVASDCNNYGKTLLYPQSVSTWYVCTKAPDKKP